MLRISRPLSHRHLLTLFISAFAFILPAAAHAQEPPQVPPALALLDRYAACQAKQQSFWLKYEMTVDLDFATSSPAQAARAGKSRIERAGEFRYDGNRYSVRTSTWGRLEPGQEARPREKAQYQSFLFDGARSLVYNRDPASTNLARFKGSVLGSGKAPVDAKTRTLPFQSAFPGRFIFGYYNALPDRIDRVLRPLDALRVRPARETAGDAECYVIDAETRGGRLAVWMDPAHDYNIARYESRRPATPSTPAEATSLTVTRFMKAGESWVPAEVVIHSTQTAKGQTLQIETHFKLTEYTADPDWETVKGFVVDDVQDGALGQVAGDSKRYLWERGMLRRVK